MIWTKRPGLAWVTTVFALLTSGAQARTPSRPPDAGCRWVEFDATALGVSMLVQDCDDPRAHYVFSTAGDWIEQHRPSDPVTYGGPRVVRVLRKPADQPIAEAIRRFAVTPLPVEARASCRVVPLTQTKPSPAGAQRFTLKPTGRYAARIERELKDGPRDLGCGEYGAGQAETWFEYHSSESRTTFLFVDAGQDEPLFDEDTLVIK